jgi:hypothetical protein
MEAWVAFLVAFQGSELRDCNLLLFTAVYCCLLQLTTAVYCDLLLFTATNCNFQHAYCYALTCWVGAKKTRLVGLRTYSRGKHL